MPTIIKNFFSFISDPRIIPGAAPLTIKSVGLLLALLLAVILPYAALMEYLGASEFDHKLEELLESIPDILLVLMAVIVAPLLEEAVFRHHLRPGGNRIWLSFLLSFILISEYYWINILVGIYFIFLLIMDYQGRMVSLKFTVYTSSVLFGLIHMSNFANFDFIGQFYWVPILVGVQFFIGLCLAYLRIHYGIWKAVMFHGLYNGILVIPALLLKDYVDVM